MNELKNPLKGSKLLLSSTSRLVIRCAGWQQGQSALNFRRRTGSIDEHDPERHDAEQRQDDADDVDDRPVQCQGRRMPFRFDFRHGYIPLAAAFAAFSDSLLLLS